MCVLRKKLNFGLGNLLCRCSTGQRLSLPANPLSARLVCFHRCIPFKTLIRSTLPSDTGGLMQRILSHADR